MKLTEKVKFSICIPAYKSKFLKACVESILLQSVDDFELIVLNDCSPEPVEEIVSHFDDLRIRYFKNDANVGSLKLVENWNKCLSLARGEYIVIMGDDDLLERDYLMEFSRLISSYPVLDVFHCRSKIIDNEGNTRMLTPSCPEYEHVYDSVWHRLNQWRSNYISDYMYKADSLKARGGFYYLPYAWGSDDITAFIASAEKGIAHSNKPVFKYRSHGLSISSAGSNDLGKLQADAGYASWLSGFLQKEPSDPEDYTIYRHLADNQGRYMRQRKVFTMAKLMRSVPITRSWTWFKWRKELGITATDILLAIIKGRKMKLSV